MGIEPNLGSRYVAESRGYTCGYRPKPSRMDWPEPKNRYKSSSVGPPKDSRNVATAPRPNLGSVYSTTELRPLAVS